MTSLQEQLQAVLIKHYSIEALPIDETETFNLSEVQVFDSKTKQYHTENYGEFAMQRFQASPDDLYKLIICEDDFPNNDELVTAMKDEEYLDVKDYELIHPVKPVVGYYLYRLIPFTVQGKPVWS